MVVFVTGGSGVVGATLVRHLVSSATEVRALSRSKASDLVVAGLGAIPVRGDVFSQGPLVEAMRGCEVVYHVAGVNQMCSPDPEVMIYTNVEGSRSVVRAADRAGVPRLVYTSSAAVIGEAHGAKADEHTAHRGFYLSDYERSKHLAEVAMLAEPTSTEVISVNPSSVQGPGRASGTGKLILDLVSGRLRVLVDTRLSIVDIDDCARGHLAAAERGVAGERYLLNSFTIETREAVEVLEGVLERSIPVRYLPARVAKTSASLVEWGARLVGKRPPICREMVATMLHGHRYDGSRAERDLGVVYTAPQDLLQRLVGWYRSEGLIDG